MKIMENMGEVRIKAGSAVLSGNLIVPKSASMIVVFAHGTGSSRLSRRNQYVAKELRNAGLGTLLFDLLTEEEDRVYENRFDIPLITARLIDATRWLRRHVKAKGKLVAYFGSSTGAAAAMQAAAQLQDISAVVSRGGRPDLALEQLSKMKAPTLLIVGGDDEQVIELNKQALKKLKCEKQLAIVPGASHLFEEPGKLEQVATLAADWFKAHKTLKHYQ